MPTVEKIHIECKLTMRLTVGPFTVKYTSVNIHKNQNYRQTSYRSPSNVCRFISIKGLDSTLLNKKKQVSSVQKHCDAI